MSVLLIFGISRVLYKEPVQELPKESKPTEEVELMVDTEETGQVQKRNGKHRGNKGVNHRNRNREWRGERKAGNPANA